jgi:hypothetical protein
MQGAYGLEETQTHRLEGTRPEYKFLKKLKIK